jgi:hypothetical protein
MNIWNSELSTAPRDCKLWLATKCGKVSLTYWDKKREAWSGMKAGEQPLAWQPYIVPEHPDHTNTDAAISGHRLALLDGPQAANRSEDEALRGMASGGVQDECAIHPANHFILDDVGSI